MNYYVYAKCGGHRIHLEQAYEGRTRCECEKHIESLARQGRMTHFLFISKLDMNDAKRRYIDGRY